MITKKIISENLRENSDFMTALQYGKLTDEIVNDENLLKAFGEPCIDDFDSVVSKIYELEFNRKLYWLQKFKSDSIYRVFTNVKNTDENFFIFLTAKIFSSK